MTIEDELTFARKTIHEYESRIQQLMQERHEPIAIVGIGLRMPGGSTTLDALADYLDSGKSAITAIPSDRWISSEFTTSSDAGFLTDIDQFDASFFSISPKEARCIDPQQRLALEVAWEALENANIDPTKLRRRDVGVYFGASSGDYAWEIGALAAEDMAGYLAGGMLNAAVSGRVSYFLGTRGPCMSIDTACSSSLVALHLAVTGLRGRECELALCGGVSVIHHPYSSMMLTDMQALAPDGRCKTFDEAADGYARAEGCGVVALKRLSDAERDGDTVLALIRGTAVRQDGESAGFTAPNGIAQEALMRAALVNAAVEPADIQYVEAHGTGTPLGDPIEMGSIAEVFGTSHNTQNPLVVASLKTNLGHMEAAAGIGGVIKTVLQLRRRTLFPHLNLDKPSSRIAWDTWPVRVPTSSQPWTADVHRALVNSFGFSGTIAAAVLEEAPIAPSPVATGAGEAAPGQGHVITVSAKSAAALASQLRIYRDSVAQRPEADVADLCYTSNVGRAHFRYRASEVVTDRDSLHARLSDLATIAGRGELPAYESRKVAFLFSGLGTLRPGVGSGLYRRHPAFAAELDACDKVLTPLVGLPVKSVLLGTCEAEDAAALSLSRYGQPVQFAFEYALAKLWMSWGVRPNAVTGHSMGEVTAAAVAGLLGLEDAATLIAARARLMESVRTPGCMVSVGANADSVAPLIADFPDVSIAAINAPQQCAISGASDSVATVLGKLAASNVDFKRLAASQASHSPLMAQVAGELRTALRDIRFTDPAITVVSAVSGQVIRLSDMSAEYWVRHIVEPVNFMGAMRALDRRGKHLFIEIGPHSTLTPLGKRCVPRGRHVWVASVRPSDRDETMVLDALAKAYMAGQPVSWADFHRGRGRRKIELPTYAFDRRSYRLPVGQVRPAPVTKPPASDGTDEVIGEAVTLPAAATGGRRAVITELIREKIASVLEFSDLAEVGPDIEFADMGMDSLLAVKLRKELCAALSVTFPTPEIFSNPTPRALAAFLDEQLQKAG